LNLSNAAQHKTIWINKLPGCVHRLGSGDNDLIDSLFDIPDNTK